MESGKNRGRNRGGREKTKGGSPLSVDWKEGETEEWEEKE